MQCMRGAPWFVSGELHTVCTRGGRGLPGQGVLDITWNGTDWNIFFLDLSYVLGPIFTPLGLSSIAVQATAQSGQKWSVLHLCLLFQVHHHTDHWKFHEEALLWGLPTVEMGEKGGGAGFNLQNWCHISSKSMNLRFLNGALESGKPVTCLWKTPPLLVLHLSHDTGESERSKNWTQYIRKINEKDGTICALSRDVWNAMAAETAVTPGMWGDPVLFLF